MGLNVNVGENLSQTHVTTPEITSIPPVPDDGEEEILIKYDSKSNDEFVATDFVFQFDSDHDDDDVPMTKGDFCKMNKKLDEIIS